MRGAGTAARLVARARWLRLLQPPPAGRHPTHSCRYLTAVDRGGDRGPECGTAWGSGKVLGAGGLFTWWLGMKLSRSGGAVAAGHPEDVGEVHHRTRFDDDHTPLGR